MPAVTRSSVPSEAFAEGREDGAERITTGGGRRDDGRDQLPAEAGAANGFRK